MGYYGSIQDMLQEQMNLAKSLKIEDVMRGKPETIGGFCQSFVGDTVISAGAVCDYRTMSIREKSNSIKTASIPYIPGYLATREAPAIIAAYEKLKEKPDVLLIGGNGIIHPRKLGIASYVGIILKKPSIGVAKSQLCGELRGDRVFVDGEMRGFCLNPGKKLPLFVSPGHMVSMETSRKIVMKCTKNDFPEPLRQASLYADEIKSKYEKDAAKGSPKKGK
ncbi:MAG: endonuclease V [Candidatus Aenigmarchaeota archaeon]|nr:endonuclease V [Candidatus Aenigmarchaeota archaeon]